MSKRSPTQSKKKLFAFAGPVGAGKTHALKDIVSKIKGTWIEIEEPLDDVLPLLAKAYESKESAIQYNLRVQLKFFNMRVRVTRAARKSISNGTQPFFAAERTVFDDIIFWNVQKRLGMIREGDDEIYRAFWSHWVELLELDDMIPDLIVYMRPDDDECWRRIQERSRECEKTLTRAYTDVVNEEHDKIYLREDGMIDIPGGKKIPVLIYKSNADFRGISGAEEAQRLADAISEKLEL
jgi:deoxyadenosine/deoxycytidine kinase